MHDESCVSGFRPPGFGISLTHSRTYKGSKIEWDNDECAAALETPLQTRSLTLPNKKQPQARAVNRFQLLNMDGSDDGSDEEEDHDTSGHSLPTMLTSTSPGVVA